MSNRRYAVIFLRLGIVPLVFLTIVFTAVWLAHGEVLESRTVMIYVVIDENEGFSSVQAAKNIIENLVQTLSQVFEINFQVSFAVSGVEYQAFPSYQEGVDLKATLSELKRIHRRVAADIVIGFSARPLWLCVEVTIPSGFSITREQCGHEKLMMEYYGRVDSTPGNVAAVRIETPEALHSLLHEVGHLFGGEHTETPSIMNTRVSDTLTIDGQNQTIIREYRLRKFR